MSAQTARLARIFTPSYAKTINAQLVYPAPTVLVKPNELESALARPQNVSYYEPDRTPAYLAASLGFGLIKGHPFMDGNKRTAFILANEYLRAHGLPGLIDREDLTSGTVDEVVTRVADRYILAAAGQLDVQGLVGQLS